MCPICKGTFLNTKDYRKHYDQFSCWWNSSLRLKMVGLMKENYRRHRQQTLTSSKLSTYRESSSKYLAAESSLPTNRSSERATAYNHQTFHSLPVSESDENNWFMSVPISNITSIKGAIQSRVVRQRRSEYFAQLSPPTYRNSVNSGHVVGQSKEATVGPGCTYSSQGLLSFEACQKQQRKSTRTYAELPYQNSNANYGWVSNEQWDCSNSLPGARQLALQNDAGRIETNERCVNIHSATSSRYPDLLREKSIVSDQSNAYKPMIDGELSERSDRAYAEQHAHQSQSQEESLRVDGNSLNINCLSQIYQGSGEPSMCMPNGKDKNSVESLFHDWKSKMDWQSLLATDHNEVQQRLLESASNDTSNYQEYLSTSANVMQPMRRRRASFGLCDALDLTRNPPVPNEANYNTTSLIFQ